MTRATEMLSEWELWACANEYIRQHGEDAPLHAAMLADDLLEKNDLDGVANWRAILSRIHQLLARPEAALN